MAELNQSKKSKQIDRPDAVGNKINSIMNKAFYTCSTESLFLRYKKISKKAVKIRGFLQCSVHIFVGHNGCFWKINVLLKALSNY